MEEVRKTKEIDIVGIIKDVLKNPKTLVVFSATFFVLGIITAFNSQKTYTSNVVLAPEIASASGMSQSITDMASNFGIDLGGKTNGIDAIYPDIYPDVLSSTDFIKRLFDIKVRTKECPEKSVTYESYCKEKAKVFSFSKMKDFFHFLKRTILTFFQQGKILFGFLEKTKVYVML